MDCPSCHAENLSSALACVACGNALNGQATDSSTNRPARRSGSRRRTLDASEAAVTDSNNPQAWFAYRVSIWSVVPVLGLFLGLSAMILGYRAARGVGDDLSASNRAKAAIAIGAGSAVTQWLGVILIYLSY